MEKMFLGAGCKEVNADLGLGQYGRIVTQSGPAHAQEVPGRRVSLGHQGCSC